VIEAKNEAETILAAVEKGRKHEAWQQLTSDEIEKIKQREDELKASVMGGDYKVIRAAIERLDQATRRFAELMMDSAVTGALGGKTMQAAGESIGEGPTAPHPFAKADIDTSPAAEAEAQKIEDSVKDEETPGESTED